MSPVPSDAGMPSSLTVSSREITVPVGTDPTSTREPELWGSRSLTILAISGFGG